MATEHGFTQREVIWRCKIGGKVDGVPPTGNGSSDNHMREAVESAFRELTGTDCEFTFSGWSAELNEAERAVVEDREPNFFKTGWAEERLHEVREILRRGEALPSYTPEQWLAVLMVKLGDAAMHLMSDPENPQPDIAFGREILLAIAAGALDAWEALGAS